MAVCSAMHDRLANLIGRTVRGQVLLPGSTADRGCCSTVKLVPGSGVSYCKMQVLKQAMWYNTPLVFRPPEFFPFRATRVFPFGQPLSKNV
jgi:hypothetical protein